MANRNEFIKYIKEFNKNGNRTIKGISNNYNGKFRGIDKKTLLKKAASLALATSLSLGIVGCDTNSYKQGETNSLVNSTNMVDEKHGNPKYLEKNEIFSKYTYIKEKLERKDELDKEEIISISNAYKEIYSSIDYIDSLDKTGEREVIDELPEMDGLFKEIEESLVDLIVNKNVLLMPEGAFDFQEKLIAQHYLINTDSNSLDNIKIARILHEKNYIVVSNKGDTFFKIYISTDEDGSIMIDPTVELENAQQIAKKGIELTQTCEKIPVARVNVKQDEELER